MALSLENRAVIERLYRPLASNDEIADADARVERLGSPEVAALELLLTRRAHLDSTPTSMSSADDRRDHSKNLERLDAAIDRLVSLIDSSDSIVVTGPAQGVLDSAERDNGSATFEPIAISVRNPRRG